MGGDAAVGLKKRIPGNKRPPSLPDMNKHSMRTKTVVTLWLIFLLIRPTHARDYESTSKSMSEARGKNGAVACVCPHASQVGLDILKSGGNGVDAAIAMQFALAVTWPSAGNIGGGGFMMIHPPDGNDVVCVEYRERAPKAATAEMFSPGDGRFTHKIVGVPGTVHGMFTAHEENGKLPWKQLVMPAIKLAESGYSLDGAKVRSVNGILASKETRAGKHLQELVRVYSKPGEKPADWSVGDKMVLPDLAKTLRRIAEQGVDGFYRGETARLLVEEMKNAGGLITEQDLGDYRSVIRPAIHGTFRGHDIYGPPLPSSGGTSVVAMLNVLENFDLRKRPRYSADNLHLIAETMKRVFCDRARYLGDPAFSDNPSRMLSKEYAKKMALDIKLKTATPSASLAPEIDLKFESPSTTHFSVIDKDGLAVSNTTTLQHSWGSRIVVKDAGFLLNNTMGDFNWFPDHTDITGNIGTKPNRIAPGKRMLSSQSPCIVSRDGRAMLVTGSPGGRTIINTSLQMILNIVEFEMSLPEAMRAERIHHQWFPDRLQFETHAGNIGPATVEDLKQRGHIMAPRIPTSHHGDAHSISVEPESGEFHGVADWRLAGKALAF